MKPEVNIQSDLLGPIPNYIMAPMTQTTIVCVQIILFEIILLLV